MLIRLTGLVTIERDGAPARHLSSAQAQVALARLILERAGGTDRDQLAETIWPVGLPDTWASALRSVVSRVRAFLAEPADAGGPLVAKGGRYLLDLPADAVVDVEGAERDVAAAVDAFAAGDHAIARKLAESALSCLRREFLPDHDADWVNETRARLDEQLMRALEMASMAAVALGDASGALRLADEAVRRAPLRESAHRCRMSAHAAAGNRAEAMRCYHELRCLLAEELGVDPAPDTQAVYVELLGNPAPTSPASAGARPRAPAPFVGRRAELATLARAWARAERGASHLVLVTGEPGAGKSRLVTEAVQQVSLAGGLVLDGLPDEPTKRPALIMLDDLDRADDDTMSLLRKLFEQRAATSSLIVATALPPARRSAAVTTVLRELDRDGWLCRIELGGLTEPEVAELARAVVPAPFLSEIPPPARLVADTGGNVHLILELLLWPCERRTDAEFSPAIHEYAAATLATLDRAARALLRTATVTGREFELDLTAAAAGLGTSAALDALDTLLAAGIVTELSAPSRRLETGGRRPYRFTHDVLRRAIRQRLSATRKRDLHTALADAIERRRANEIDRYIPALAYHRAAAGDPRAVRWVWRVAESTGGRESVRLHRKALRHVPAGDDGLRAEALTKLGLAELAAGERGAAQTLLDGALHAVHSDRIEVASRAALGLADGVELFPELRGEAAALVDLLVAETGPLDGVTVGRLLARQLRLGSRLATAPAAAALSALAERLSRLEGPDQVHGRLTLATEMLAVATEVHDTVNRIIAAHHQAMAAELLGDLATRQAALAALSDAVIATATDPFGDALLLDQSVATAVTQGRFTDAAAITKLASGLPGGQVHGISPAPGSLARRQMLVAGLLRWSALPAETDDGTGAELAERTLRALAGGDRGRPHLTVRAFATGARALPATDEWPHLMGVLAIGGVEVGDPTTAEALLARLSPYADLVCGVGYRTFVGPVSLHLGRLSTVIGDWDAAERHLTSSLSYLDNKRARPWTALAKHSLARALEGRARADDRRFARTLRMEANSSLAHLGLRHCAT